MPTREIWHEILIHASAAKIYAALTETDQLAHWWTTDVRGISKVGQTLEFWFSGYRASIMEVIALHPNELVQWKTMDGLAQDWIGTTLEFNIFQQEGKMLLHLRHSQWKEDARSFAHSSMGWSIFLLSLKEFVETGKGRPHPYDMPVNLWIPPQAAVGYILRRHAKERLSCSMSLKQQDCQRTRRFAILPPSWLLHPSTGIS